MGPTWVLSAPDGPHVGLMNFAIRDTSAVIHQMAALRVVTFSRLIFMLLGPWQLTDAVAFGLFDLKFSNGRSRYIIHTTLGSWHYARRFCHSKGYHLVTINNATEQTFLDGKIGMFARQSHFWIGLNDLDVEGRYTWEPSGLRLSYTRWRSGQPNNLGGHQNCILIQKRYGWHDADCRDRHVAICELN